MDEHKVSRKGRPTSIGFEGSTSRTQQSYGESVQVDAVLKRYATQGFNPKNVGLFQQTVAQMPFGISDQHLDYQKQLNMVIEVRQYFEGLPSRIRAEFNNNPVAMIEFMADPANKQACIKMGLLAKPKAPEVPAKATNSEAENESEQSVSEDRAKKPEKKQKPAQKPKVELEADDE